MTKVSKSVGLDEELADELARVSDLEGRTSTQTIRRAIKVYLGMFNGYEALPYCLKHDGHVGTDPSCTSCGFGVRTDPGD